MRKIALISALVALSAQAFADAPRVAADILPVHSLVAQVMGGIGEPELILPPGDSAHHRSLRPSEARGIAGSDIIFSVGQTLNPGLAKQIGTLAGDSTLVHLDEASGTLLLPARSVKDHGQENHLHEHDDHDSDHEDPATQHSEHHGDDDHAMEDAIGLDPHAWLDPENAKLWLDTIAETLASADAANASVYFANASRGRSMIDAAKRQAHGILGPSQKIAVAHDAYQYFEHRFGLPMPLVISDSHATAPGAAHLDEIRDVFAQAAITCVLTDPETNLTLVSRLTEGTNTAIVPLDPLGGNLQPGPDHYPQLILHMAKTIATCVN